VTGPQEPEQLCTCRCASGFGLLVAGGRRLPFLAVGLIKLAQRFFRPRAGSGGTLAVPDHPGAAVSGTASPAEPAWASVPQVQPSNAESEASDWHDCRHWTASCPHVVHRRSKVARKAVWRAVHMRAKTSRDA